MIEKNLKISELNEEDRPMEKLISYGVSSLNNVELLAIIIGSGTRGKSSIDLAYDIIYDKIGEKDLLYSSAQELMSIKGIGKSKATRIISGLELGRRLGKIDSFSKISFSSPKTVADYFYRYYRNKSKEEFCVVLLDTKNKPISIESVSVGTLNSSLVHPREVFRQAIKKNANAIILVHNHPSGDPSTSKEDLVVTKRLIETGKIVGIKVLDHVIIGINRYESLKAIDLM